MTDKIISILVGLTTAIPLIISLVKYVGKAIKEKNWTSLITLVTKLMAEAESKFATGAERKEWVLAMVKASADTINYDVDIAAVASLIDSLCDLTKKVNTGIEEYKRDDSMDFCETE